MEARDGIEPTIKVLQTFALPLGDRALSKKELMYSNISSRLDSQQNFRPLFRSGTGRSCHPSLRTGPRIERHHHPAALTVRKASCTMSYVGALSSAVRAFGLHPKGRPFKSDSAHHKSRVTSNRSGPVLACSTLVKHHMRRAKAPVMHCSTSDVSPFSGDVVQLVRTLPCHQNR